MPRRTKITIVFILGLGVLASIATIIRLPYLRYYDTSKYPNDFICKTKDDNRCDITLRQANIVQFMSGSL